MSKEKNNILKDETLDFNKSKQYWMSILIEKSGLSFVITDTVTLKVIAYHYQELPEFDNQKEYCYFINKEFKTNAFCAYDFKNISVIFKTNKSVLIPENLYSDSYKKKFFELNVNLQDKDIILHNNIYQMGAKKLFAIPSCMYNGILDAFPKAKIYHQTTGLIKSAYLKKDFEKVYLSIYKTFFDIQIFDKDKLILDNSFKFKTKEDLLYYLLYTFEQLNLDPKKQALVLLVGTDTLPENVDFIKNYIAEIDFIKSTDKISFSYLFSKEKISQLSSQIKLLECEL